MAVTKDKKYGVLVENVGKMEPLCPVGNVNWCWKMKTTTHPTISFIGIYLKKIKY